MVATCDAPAGISNNAAEYVDSSGGAEIVETQGFRRGDKKEGKDAGFGSLSASFRVLESIDREVDPARPGTTSCRTVLEQMKTLIADWVDAT